MIVLGGNNVDIHVGVDVEVSLKKVICLHWSLFSPPCQCLKFDMSRLLGSRKSSKEKSFILKRWFDGWMVGLFGGWLV